MGKHTLVASGSFSFCPGLWLVTGMSTPRPSCDRRCQVLAAGAGGDDDGAGGPLFSSCRSPRFLSAFDTNCPCPTSSPGTSSLHPSRTKKTPETTLELQKDSKETFFGNFDQ